MNKTEELAKTILFRDFPSEHLTQIAEIATERRVPAGTTLFEEGEHGDELFVLIMGTISVVKRGEQGEEAEVGRLGSGSYFGEVAVVSGRHERMATAHAEEMTTLLVIQQSDIEALAEADHIFGHNFYRTLCAGLARRLRISSTQAAHLKWAATRRR